MARRISTDMALGGFDLRGAWKNKQKGLIPKKTFGNDTFMLIRIHDQPVDVKDDMKNMQSMGWKVRTTKEGYYTYLWVGGRENLKKYFGR